MSLTSRPMWSNTPGSLRRDRIELRAEAGGHRIAQQGLVPEVDAIGPRAGALGQLGVLGQARDLELLEPVLAGAEHLAGTPDLEVDLSQVEAVAGPGDRLEPRQFGIPEEDAQRGVLATPHPAAQLVELRE